MVKRWFIDTEFMEEPGWMNLLSIGMVSEDGTQKIYAINREADISRANDWVRRNVLPRLFRQWAQYAATIEQIRAEILQLIPPKPEDPGVEWSKPEFWGYYCDYDWVNFCWIFGRMMNLPKGYPMYCLDLKQVSKLNSGRAWDGTFQKQDESQEHHALNDACWNRETWLYLRSQSLVPQ